MMNFNKIVVSLGLLFVVDVFASEKKQAPCKNQMVCQFYKYCALRYNREHGTSVNIQEDEVKSEVLRQEIAPLAEKISFVDANGVLIAPAINPNTGNLALTALSKECANYQLAQWILKSYEKSPKDRMNAARLVTQNPGALKLGETFDRFKSLVIQDHTMICGRCSR